MGGLEGLRGLGAIAVPVAWSVGTLGCCWRLSAGAGQCQARGGFGHAVWWVLVGRGAGAVRGRRPAACAVT